MRELKISRREEGQKLFRYLGKYMPAASGGFLHKMLRKKNIKLNQKKADGTELLREGDCIQIFFSEETLNKFCGGAESPESPRAGDLPDPVILYRNEDILFLHKPAGMLTQKARPEDVSLNDLLLAWCRRQGILDPESTFRPSVANRLDRNTSGIVLAGISIRGLQLLAGLLKERGAEKYYLAPVAGRMTGRRHISGYLNKDEKKNRVTFSEEKAEGAARIETEYEVLEERGDFSLLRIRLITGKSHQIRAHLAAIGHPLAGDYKYGSPGLNRRLKKEYGLDHHLLHCMEVVIPDFDGEKIRVTDPVPEDFLAVTKGIGFSV